MLGLQIGGNMMQALLVASLLFNAGLVYKVTADESDSVIECKTYECEAYEDFLEEWHKYDLERQQLEEDQEMPEFDYQYPEEEYDGPTEEI